MSLIKISTIFLIIICNSLFSQSVTVSDINYGMTHTLSETEDYLSNKGYRYLGNIVHVAEPLHKYVFTCISCKEGNKAQFGVIVNENTKKVVEIEINMENRNNQLAIRNKAKELGYKIIKENGQSGILSTSYEKGKSQFVFSTENDEKFGICYLVTYW